MYLVFQLVESPFAPLALMLPVVYVLVLPPSVTLTPGTLPLHYFFDVLLRQKFA